MKLLFLIIFFLGMASKLRYDNPSLKHLFTFSSNDDLAFLRSQHERERKRVVDASKPDSGAPLPAAFRPDPLATTPVHVFEEVVSDLTFKEWKEYQLATKTPEGLRQNVAVSVAPFVLPSSVLQTSGRVEPKTELEMEAAELFLRILIAHKNRKMGWHLGYQEGTDLSHYLAELRQWGGCPLDLEETNTREDCLRFLFQEQQWLFAETLEMAGGRDHQCSFFTCRSSQCTLGRRLLDCQECGCHPHSFPRGRYFFASLGRVAQASGDVFVCPMTGKVHVCDQGCAGTLVWEGQEYVCPISGNSRGILLNSATEKMSKDVYRDLRETVEREEQNAFNGAPSGPATLKRRRKYSHIRCKSPDTRGIDKRASALVDSLGKETNPLWCFLKDKQSSTPPPPESPPSTSPVVAAPLDRVRKPRHVKKQGIDLEEGLRFLVVFMGWRVTWRTQVFVDALEKVACNRLEIFGNHLRKKKGVTTEGYAGYYSLISCRFPFAGLHLVLQHHLVPQKILGTCLELVTGRLNAKLRQMIAHLVEHQLVHSIDVLRRVLSYTLSQVQVDESSGAEWFLLTPSSGSTNVPSQLTNVVKKWLPELRLVDP